MSPRQEFGSFKDVHAVGVKKKNGHLTAGPVYCPTYIVKGTEGQNPEKVLIDDEAYTSDTETGAAVIAIRRRVDTELSDLIWTRKVAVVTLSGVAHRKGRVGIFDVFFIAGPTFDLGKRSDDNATARRIATGQPTGLPGSRRIIVPAPSTGKPGWRRLD